MSPQRQPEGPCSTSNTPISGRPVCTRATGRSRSAVGVLGSVGSAGRWASVSQPGARSAARPACSASTASRAGSWSTVALVKPPAQAPCSTASKRPEPASRSRWSASSSAVGVLTSGYAAQHVAGSSPATLSRARSWSRLAGWARSSTPPIAQAESSRRAYQGVVSTSRCRPSGLSTRSSNAPPGRTAATSRASTPSQPSRAPSTDSTGSRPAAAITTSYVSSSGSPAGPPTTTRAARCASATASGWLRSRQVTSAWPSWSSSAGSWGPATSDPGAGRHQPGDQRRERPTVGQPVLRQVRPGQHLAARQGDPVGGCRLSRHGLPLPPGGSPNRAARGARPACSGGRCPARRAAISTAVGRSTVVPCSCGHCRRIRAVPPKVGSSLDRTIGSP